MPSKNFEEISSTYPFAREIKEAIPLVDFETIEVGGEEKLKLRLDLTNPALIHSLQKRYGNDFERLPQEIKNHIGKIGFADVTCTMRNEHGLEDTLKNITTLLPKVKFLGIKNTERATFPQRLFDQHLDTLQLLEGTNYPEDTITTYNPQHVQIINNVINDLHSKHDLEGLGIKFEFDYEGQSDSLRVERLTEELLSQIEDPASLQQIALFANVDKLTFESSFADPATFTSNLERVRKLFPNIKSLEINKTYQPGTNKIDQDFDFSPLTGFQQLKSLAIPVTAPRDYLFLNDMEVSELRLSPPTGGYDLARSSAKMEQLASNIHDNVAERIKKLRIYHCPLGQETFDRICHQFDALEELSVSTVEHSRDYRDRSVSRPLVGDSNALLRLGSLQKLSIDNLVLTPGGPGLESLTELRLDSPGILTMKMFGDTATSLRNLEKLTVTSSYDNECEMVSYDPWNHFFAGISKLPELSEVSLSRKTQSNFTRTGSAPYMASSGGAGTQQIDQSVVDAFAHTKLNKLSLNGFTYDPALNTEKRRENKRILELVSAKRDENSKANNGAILPPPPPTEEEIKSRDESDRAPSPNPQKSAAKIASDKNNEKHL